jgi:hypothetical protein
MIKQKGYYVKQREIYVEEGLKAIVDDSPDGVKLIDVMYKDGHQWHRWSEEIENPASFRIDYDSAKEVREAILEEIK